ncbi:MAG: L-seryl-tRNA(Sec) selenium transferase [Chloroflexi bacterium]|nr:L-seryl-tRNA(Sec) selenium transferase [Chloroflexota bacterium]
MVKTALSAIPSVDKLLGTNTAADLVAEYGRPLTLEAIRRTLAEIREQLKDQAETIPDSSEMLQRAREILVSWTTPTLLPAINATGVVLHTNLGRAPLSEESIQAMHAIAQGYSTLEYDIIKGKRGSRYTHAEKTLLRLTGAEGALVVNNNASALLLVLTALARRRKVVISRTQLIEIGGGFRIPDVLKQSGAKLVEIGTTNRVHLRDYENALAENKIALLMRAHRSNFRMEGFTSEPSLEELSALSREAEIPFLDDLGSGSFIDTAQFDLKHEMTVQESLSAGADLVCFSGDKLLGGPQAGIIVGRDDLIAKLKKHPLARAIRADKLALAGLTTTLMHYLKDEAERKIPIWQMISTPTEKLAHRANVWMKTLGRGSSIKGETAVGGGSLPGETLPTHLFVLKVRKPEKFLKHLREASPPIIARLRDNLVMLDPRTVLPEQEEDLIVGLQSALATKAGSRLD